VDRTTVARWESGEYTPQPWLCPKIAEALGLSLGEYHKLLDEAGEAGTTGHTAGVSTALVEAPELSEDALLAGHDEMPAAQQDHDRLSQEMELVRAYADALALRAASSLPQVQVPWKVGQGDRIAQSGQECRGLLT
jgi:DNA-binding XRE family transcriptional regulator